MKNENEKLGQEPAFPVESKEYGNIGVNEIGMSKRFYAACCAMQGWLSNETFIERIAKAKRADEVIAAIIVLSYASADELLKQENKEQL